MLLPATYCSELSKCSHLKLVSWVAKTCTKRSRLVADTSHPVNNHYNSIPDTIWTNIVLSTVISPVLLHFYTLSHKIHDFRTKRKSIEYKNMCFYCCCTMHSVVYLITHTNTLYINTGLLKMIVWALTTITHSNTLYINRGLFKMTVWVLTTCNTHYTSDSNIRMFSFI